MFVRSEDGKRIDAVPVSVDEYTGKFYIYSHEYRMATYATEQEALARMDDVNAWLDAPERRDVLHLKQICNAGTLETTEEPTILVVRKPAVYQFSKPIGFWKEGVSNATV